MRESADIVAWADARMPEESRLYPRDPDALAEVRRLERDFDERLGPEGRRWMYDGLRGRRDLAIAYACTGVPSWERRALPVVYPVVMQGHRPLPRHHADDRDRVGEGGPGDLRRGRRKARRRAPVPVRRALQRRRPDLRGSRGAGPDATRVRSAVATAGRVARGDRRRSCVNCGPIRRARTRCGCSARSAPLLDARSGAVE